MTERLPALRSLQIFAIAADKCSFKLAAEQLCITPQAVSLQVKALEEQLGFALFQRQPSGISLTPAGEQLFDYVQHGIALIQRGVQEVSRQQQKTPLRLSVSPWFAVHCLLPHLPEFEQQHPHIEVQLNTSVPFPDFQTQQLDLAIQWGFGQWPFADKQLLLTDDKLLVCAPQLLETKPLRHKQDLRHHRLLCTKLSVELWRKLIDTLGVDALVEQQALPLDSHAGVFEAVCRGLGVALVTVSDAQEGMADGMLVAPLGDSPISALNPGLMPGYWLVRRDGAEHNRAIALFCDWMQGWLQDHPRAARPSLT